MNPPSPSTRLIGKPRVAALLYVVIACAIVGWMGGAVHWLIGLIALCLISTVRSATLEVRRYEAWAAEWNAMGGYYAPGSGKAKTPAGRGKLLVQALVFAFSAYVFSKMTPTGQKPSAVYVGLCLVMFGAALWKAGAFLAACRRSRSGERATKKHVGSKAAVPSTEFVEWALPPASSSPSRSDATHHLPDYAARLLTGGMDGHSTAMGKHL